MNASRIACCGGCLRESEAEPRKKEGYCKVARAGRRLSFVDDG
jgi:hypothetical protein